VKEPENQCRGSRAWCHGKAGDGSTVPDGLRNGFRLCLGGVAYGHTRKDGPTVFAALPPSRFALWRDKSPRQEGPDRESLGAR